MSTILGVPVLTPDSYFIPWFWADACQVHWSCLLCFLSASFGFLFLELHIFDPPRLDTRQALMWIGCDDGTLYVVSGSPGLLPFTNGYRTLNCEQPVLSIVHINNKVFVALNKRRIHIYHRNHGESSLASNVGCSRLLKCCIIPYSLSLSTF